MSFGRRQLSIETIALFFIGAIFVGVGAFMCVSAYRAGEAPASRAGPPLVASLAPALPPAMPPTAEPEPAPAPAEFAPAPAPSSIFAPPTDVDVPAEPLPAQAPPPLPQRQTSPSVVLGPSAPFPAPRPIELNGRPPPAAPTIVSPSDADDVALGPKPGALRQYDRFTAVYDLTAHTVYLPTGQRLEAHSGLGALKDDPAHVTEVDRGATPPHLYELSLREDLFHGVQALRLNPIGGAAAIFGRAGLLAHTYMLGPNGDSNGCVSFKNYDAFLQAFQSGQIKHLAVVSSLNGR